MQSIELQWVSIGYTTLCGPVIWMFVCGGKVLYTDSGILYSLIRNIVYYTLYYTLHYMFGSTSALAHSPVPLNSDGPTKPGLLLPQLPRGGPLLRSCLPRPCLLVLYDRMSVGCLDPIGRGGELSYFFLVPWWFFFNSVDADDVDDVFCLFPRSLKNYYFIRVVSNLTVIFGVRRYFLRSDFAAAEFCKSGGLTSSMALFRTLFNG